MLFQLPVKTLTKCVHLYCIIVYIQYMCVIYLAGLTSDDANVSRDSVASLDLHQIPHHQLVGVDLVFLAITDHNGLLFLEIGQISKDE